MTDSRDGVLLIATARPDRLFFYPSSTEPSSFPMRCNMSSQGETESLKITGLPLGTTHALEELARVHDQTAEE